jgi:outer membrane lipoprotein carrier protein
MLKVLALIFLNCFVTQAYAEDAIGSLTNLLLGVHTMQADFSQNVKDKSARSLFLSGGHMALERPGKFRWDVTRPNPQLIIANGTKLWVYDKDLEQVTIRAFHKAAGQTPALLLSDSTLDLNKDFTVQEGKNFQSIANYRIFILTPKDKEDPFETIKISFIDKHLHDMQLEDKLGHVTTIAFQNVKTGIPLAASLFTFQPPPHVDVIDETKSLQHTN